jgi:Ca-activated chloride channel homolog
MILALATELVHLPGKPAGALALFRAAFAQPPLLLVLAVLPALALLALWARRQRRLALTHFGLSGLTTAALASGRGLFVRLPRALGRLCLLFGLLGLCVGLAGPRWGRDWGQTATPRRDLVVVLDCSGSMRAEVPSRLERARRALLDLTASLRQRGGHRVALVTFAGKARLVCPLTHDLDHFREAVEAIDLTNPSLDLEAESGPSGTRIGQALLVALSAWDQPMRASRDLLLLSDGDDPAGDGEWRTGIARARAEGVPIHCVGLGDPDEERPIPLGKGWLMHEGRPVTSRLKEAPLREIAGDTGGTLVLAGTRRLALGEHYLTASAGRSKPAEGGEDAADAMPVLRQRYFWFLLPAFVLLSASLVFPGLARSWPRHLPGGQRSPGFACLFLGAALALGAATAPGPGPEALLREGNAAFQRGDHAGAIALYEQAEARATNPGLVAFNLASAKYHLALSQDSPSPLLREAEQLYRCCLGADDPRRPRAWYGLGNCLLRRETAEDLRAAIACYEHCLGDRDSDQRLRKDAAYNRQRARLQLAQLQVQAGSTEEPPGEESNNTPKRLPDKQPGTTETPGAGDGSEGARPDERTGTTPAKVGPGEQPIQTDAPPAPGAGSLPPVPDQANLSPLAREDAVEHLKRAAQRILEEGQTHRASKGRKTAAGVRDW